jgi:hypothetical protein
MRKFRLFMSYLFTVPGALLMLLSLFMIGLGGLVIGEGFSRTFGVLADEVRDAMKIARARLLASTKR